jgi:hypothetical protein
MCKLATAIANCFTQFSFAWSKAHRLFRPGARRSVWRSVGATRKRRTCDCAICNSTETISGATRTSQITASPSFGLRGSPAFPCRAPSSRLNSPQDASSCFVKLNVAAVSRLRRRVQNWLNSLTTPVICGPQLQPSAGLVDRMSMRVRLAGAGCRDDRSLCVTVARTAIR